MKRWLKVRYLALWQARRSYIEVVHQSRVHPEYNAETCVYSSLLALLGDWANAFDKVTAGLPTDELSALLNRYTVTVRPLSTEYDGGFEAFCHELRRSAVGYGDTRAEALQAMWEAARFFAEDIPLDQMPSPIGPGEE